MCSAVSPVVTSRVLMIVVPGSLSASVTAVPSLMASIMSAVINGIIIWQITSPSTSSGVAIVTFM